MSTTNTGVTPEDKMVPLDTSGVQETEVEVPAAEETSAPVAAPAAPPPAAPAAAAEEDNEQEEYSASVKRRIDRLTRKMREAERQREEALRFATTVKSEAEVMRNRLQNLDAGYLREHGSRLNLEQKQAEALLKHAVSVSDADLTVEAQKKIAQLAIANERFQAAQAQQAQQQAQWRAQQQAEAQRPAQQAQPQARRPDPKAETWASKNEWFGKDEAMTFAAFGVHKRLVEDEGFDPQSDEYYSELDRRMAREFPHKIQSSQPQAQVQTQRPTQAVAGVSRSGQLAPARARKVRLTPSQVAIAKRLGVPLEEYAKYVKE